MDYSSTGNMSYYMLCHMMDEMDAQLQTLFIYYILQMMQTYKLKPETKPVVSVGLA